MDGLDFLCCIDSDYIIFSFISVTSRYNNKTYRIDDIDWFQNPQSTFNKGGTQVSYIDYYKKVLLYIFMDPLVYETNLSPF